MKHYEDGSVTLHHGDCLDVLRELPDASVDAVVTDPPYGLANTDPAHVAETITRWVNGERDYLPGGSGFMGKEWDAFVPPAAVWDECLRVLKPGGHVLTFAGSRTVDLMTLGLRLAGFDIRDSIAWLYGSGFPKSLDVSKAIDKAAGAERERTARPAFGGTFSDDGGTTYGTVLSGDAVTDAAERWQGWGTALKPAFEPIVVARKPLTGTVAANVLEHGTGALNIDACRIDGEANRPMPRAPQGGILRLDGCHSEAELRALAEAGKKTPTGRDARATLARAIADRERYRASGEKVTNTGRWPTNVVLDDTQAAALDEPSGELSSGGPSSRDYDMTDRPRGGDVYAGGIKNGVVRGHPGTGGASRFFPTFRYEAKAPASERPKVPKRRLRLRDDLTPEQVDHVRARLAEAGVRVD